MAITHRFEDSRDTFGYGYFACIEDGQLVIAEDWPREGGVTYRGTYVDAGSRLEQLKTEDECLYYSIKAYFANPKHREEADTIKLPGNAISAKDARAKGDKIREDNENPWHRLFAMINEKPEQSTVIFDEYDENAYFKVDRKRVKQELEKLGYKVEYSRAYHDDGYNKGYHNKYRISW